MKSREDELLQRLKSCVGNVPTNSYTMPDERIVKPNTNEFKLRQVPQQNKMKYTPVMQLKNKQNDFHFPLPQSNRFKSYERKQPSQSSMVSIYSKQIRLNTKQLSKQKEPLVQSNRQQQRMTQIENKYMRGRNTEISYQSYRTQQKPKPENPSQRQQARFSYQNRLSENKFNYKMQNTSNNTPINNSRQVKQDIGQKYNLMRLEMSKPSNPLPLPPKENNSLKESARPKYQDEMQARKMIINSGTIDIKENHQRRKSLFDSISSDNLVENKNDNDKQKKQSVCTKNSSQNVDKSNSALTKLKKISQLNEKINQRIRNIINVFEEHQP